MIELGKVRDSVIQCFRLNRHLGSGEDSWGLSRDGSVIVVAGRRGAVRVVEDSLTFINKSKRRDK